MSIVALAAKRCQPTSPNSIVAWSPEEEIAAATALRKELSLARSHQCRRLFVEREKRVSQERQARLALEEALARHEATTAERDEARKKAADAATLAARRRLSAGSAHRDADVASGETRESFQQERLRARQRRDDALQRSRAAADVQRELNLERDARKIQAEQRWESRNDAAAVQRARAVKHAAKMAEMEPDDDAPLTEERDFTRDETYNAGGPCVQTRGEGITEVGAWRTTVPATRHAAALTHAAAAATDAAARIRRTAQQSPAGLAAADAAEKAAARRRRQAEDAQRALQMSQKRGLRATRKDMSRRMADRTQLELDRHRLKARADAKRKAPGVVLQSLRDERAARRAQRRGDFGEATQAAEDVVEAAAEAAYRAAAPTGFADIIRRSQRPSDTGASPSPPRILSTKPVELSAKPEASASLQATRWSDRRDAPLTQMEAPSEVVPRPRPPPPTPSPEKEAVLADEDEDVLDEAFLKELAEEGDRLDAEASPLPSVPAAEPPADAAEDPSPPLADVATEPPSEAPAPDVAPPAEPPAAAEAADAPPPLLDAVAAAPALDAVIPEPPSPTEAPPPLATVPAEPPAVPEPPSMDTRETMAFVEATLAADDAAAAAAPPSPDEDDTLSSTTRRFHTTHHDGDLVFKAPAAEPEPAAPVAFERLTEPVSLEDEDAPPEPAPEAAAPTPAPEDAPGPSPFEAAIARRRAVDAAPDDAFAAHVLPGDGIDFTEPITPVPTTAAPTWEEPPTPTLDAPAFASATPHQETFMDALPRRDLDAALDEAPGQGTWYDETYSDLSPLQDDRDAINAAADRAVAAAEAELRTRDEILESYVQAALDEGAPEAKEDPLSSPSTEPGPTTELPRDDAVLGLPPGLRSGDADALAAWARRTLAETGSDEEEEASSPETTSESALDAAERLLRSLSPDRPRVPSDSSPDISPTERLATSSSSSEDGLDDVLRRLEELTAAMRERSARYEAADASDNALRDLLRDE